MRSNRRSRELPPHPTQVGGLRTRTRAGHLGHLAAPEISWGVGGPGTCPGPPRAPPRGGRFGRGKEEFSVTAVTVNSNFPRQGRRLLWRLLGPENCGGDAGGQEVSNDVRYSPLGARVGQPLAWAPIRHRQACHRTPLRPPVAVELVTRPGGEDAGCRALELGGGAGGPQSLQLGPLAVRSRLIVPRTWHI